MPRKVILANSMRGLVQRNGTIAYQHLDGEEPKFQSFYCKDYFMEIIYSEMNNVNTCAYGLTAVPLGLRTRKTNNFLLFETKNGALPKIKNIVLALNNLQKGFKPFNVEEVDVKYEDQKTIGYLITYDTKIWEYPYYFSFITEIMRNCHNYKGETWKEYLSSHNCPEFSTIRYATFDNEKIEMYDSGILKKQIYPQNAERNAQANIHGYGAFFAILEK